ncbi:toll/interleukin-1 receptor domain-containing protein [Actinomadura opuntiae]|uniref:toll/interleukin-1 receptor domain-containing protein n=1 Tax=Actinomadura sp. OS1-43 TaxID=604315 RepID=UPI00255AEF99|nr:toll/interleukin-1 receptor domain-containing protein [Actinomadura sp. OS1-43]MDL4816024.1 toll/interleukin-1 receptor domain-containing protein [Actinomadura sp. OS1-43]
MAAIFINYRSGDDAYAAALLDILLSNSYGANEVFRASRSIEPGDDYAKAIISAIEECDVFLAIIGARWHETIAKSTYKQDERPGDWVVHEISCALKAGVKVVPVLLAGAQRPNESHLPDSIKEVAQYQYLRFDYRNIENDFLNIIAKLAGVIERGTRDQTVDSGSLRLNIGAILGIFQDLSERINKLEK